MESLLASWSLPGPSGWLALVRVWLGVIWAWQALEKFWTGEFRDLSPKLQRMAATNPHPWYADFLKRSVLPRARWISPAVAAGELAVGLGLMTGIFAGGAAAAGIILNANYYLAAGQNLPCNRPLNFLMIGIQAILIAAGSGRSLSVAGLIG